MIKIKLRYHFLLFTSIYLYTACVTPLKNLEVNEYGLKVILHKKQYGELVAVDTNQKMIHLPHWMPNLLIDLRYASNNNFTKSTIYSAYAGAYLRLPAARALQAVQNELNQQGLGLKIFDAYRPYAATKLMWNLVRDDRYTASPATGSGHNRGAAVDLTLVDLRTGLELPMPTGFDSFNDSAHHSFMNLPANVLQNRNLLKNIMEKHGFVALETEWWHYSLPNAKDRFMLMNIDFEDFGMSYKKE
jgi:zinc D-Ala-D-Ala dipeptidase